MVIGTCDPISNPSLYYLWFVLLRVAARALFEGERPLILTKHARSSKNLIMGGGSRPLLINLFILPIILFPNSDKICPLFSGKIPIILIKSEVKICDKAVIVIIFNV